MLLCADGDALLRRRFRVCRSGPGHAALADNKSFALRLPSFSCLLLAALNIVGLGVGKWVNNLGGIGTGIAALVLIGLGIASGCAFWRQP